VRQTLSEILEARIRAGELQPDPAQQAVLQRLEAVRHWLEAQAAQPRTGLRGLFARPALPPKGLYLWGGVGRTGL
jgi:cell division protein ZapE